MSWETKKFSQIMKITKGEAITKASESEGPYPVILGGQEPAYYIDRYNHEGKAIVISRSGASAGYASFWDEPIFITDGFLVEPKENNHFEYLYYLLKYYEKAIHDLQNGSAIPHVTPKTLYNLKGPIPTEDVQIRIAGILSAYDNIIEVNNKRIKVLEQMAENLYKEWFVRFRFPGHETAEFENGIPKGWLASSGLKPKKWHYGPVAELGMFVRGRNITSDEMVDGQIPVVSAGIEPSGYHNESNVRGKNITISASGANAGYMKYNLEDIWAADCSYMVCNEAFWFIYHSLKFIQPVISNLQCGAAQPHVYPKHINKICIIIPEKKYILNFCNIVSPYYDEIGRLIKQNENLKTQRDLLLPRLMSGKLEV